MSHTRLSPAYRAFCRRALRESIPRPAKASDLCRAREEIAEALALVADDAPPASADDRAVWGFDVDPLAFDDEGDRWVFDDSPYADAP